MVDYLSTKALTNLKHYKYSSIDKSPLSNYVLRHYWDFVVNLFPLWIAPNCITLIGFGFVCFNLFCALVFTPDLVGPGPQWLYFSYAIGIWLYSTFDNVDGKQARRTKSSSPLGELFDHGCDALNCTVGSLVQASAMAGGMSWYTVGTVFMAMCAFFLTTWEEYHTGTLYLGFINGPTEGLILACLFSIVSGVAGPLFWQTPLIWLFPSVSWIPPAWRLIDVVFWGMMFLLITTHAPFCLINVYRACRKSSSKHTFVGSLLQILPTLFFFLANYFWLAAPYSIALSNHLVKFVLAGGVVFGRMVTKIILAHVTKMAYPVYSTNMLIPLLLGCFAVNAPNVIGVHLISANTESVIIHVYLIVSIINYSHWALLVIQKFCDHLGINCLTLAKKKAC